jgi:hypothetical protein
MTNQKHFCKNFPPRAKRKLIGIWTLKSSLTPLGPGPPSNGISRPGQEAQPTVAPGALSYVQQLTTVCCSTGPRNIGHASGTGPIGLVIRWILGRGPKEINGLRI